LANFFGENPSVDPIKKQIFSITMNLNIKDSALQNSNKLLIDESLIYNDDDAESSNERLKSTSQIIYDDSSSEYDSSQCLSTEDLYSLKRYSYNELYSESSEISQSQELKNSTIFTMKKKADKLQHFFGDKIQINQLYEQQALQNEIGENGLGTMKFPHATGSVDYLSNINNLFNTKGTVKFGKRSQSIDDLPRTENLMDNSQRKMMTKRTNKINSILGTVIDEKLTGTVIESANTTNSRRDLSEGSSKLYKSSSCVEDLATEEKSITSEVVNSPDSDSDFNSNKGNMIQIKRMKKLHQLFGERINMETLIKLQIKRNEIEKKNKIEKGIFTEYERKDIRNRCKKLENIFGTYPPTLMVNLNTKSTENNAFMKHRKSIISLSMMFTYDKEVADVMDIVSMEVDGGNPTIPQINDDDDNGNNKEVNKTKLKKLRKFFGDDADPASIINSIIISDLRKAIEKDITDKEQKKQLNKELDIIWEDIQEKSKHFMDTITEEDTCKINENGDISENFLKVTQSLKKYKSFDLGKSKKKGSLSSNQLKNLCEEPCSDGESDDSCDSKWKDYVIDWLKTNHKI